MILALALLAVAGPSVAEAERAFAAQAETGPQWAAFRATAAPGAIVYAPGPVQAQAYFARLPEPKAKLNWRPAHTITSCDGTLAYSAGPWSAGGKSGNFGTIWQRDTAGWKWLYDNGHDGGALADAPVGRLVEDQASCSAPSASIREPSDDSLPDAAALKHGGEFGGVGFNAPISVAALKNQALAGLIEASDGLMPLALKLGAIVETLSSRDRTLVCRINVIMTDTTTGAHLLRIWSWDGRRYRLAVLDVSGTGVSAK